MSNDLSYPQDDTLTASEGLTPTTTVGPFFHDSLPYQHGPRLAGPRHNQGVTLTGRVTDGAADPITDALVEIWQADDHGDFVEGPGIYDMPDLTGFRGFGRCATDTEGRFEFFTVKPAAVPTIDGEPQAPHIAMSVLARGMLRRAVTRVYFDDEATRNASDPLLCSLEAARRATLVATSVDGGYRFDVRIQGDDETVFLDVFAR